MSCLCNCSSQLQLITTKQRARMNPIRLLVFTSFWCLLKLTNRLHYGKKTMRVNAREAMHNFLSVVQPKCWDVGLLFCVSEKQIKKQILYHRRHSTRSTLFKMAGQPILCENPNHPCKPLNVICEGQIFFQKKIQPQKQWMCHLRSTHLIKESVRRLFRV